MSHTRFRAHQRHRPGEMNKLEARYAEYLEGLRLGGDIVRWQFEKITLKLAHDMRFTPDFWILYPDGHGELHDTKGFMREDAKLKLKIAVEQFPEFLFAVVTWDKRGGWQFEKFG